MISQVKPRGPAETGFSSSAAAAAAPAPRPVPPIGMLASFLSILPVRSQISISVGNCRAGYEYENGL